MAATIRSVETIIVALPREIPYLGPIGRGRARHEPRLFRSPRQSNDLSDHRSLRDIKDSRGRRYVGWGETYGIVAPQAVVAIISDVLGPLLVGREPIDIPAIWDELYALMRVRGRLERILHRRDRRCRHRAVGSRRQACGTIGR